jgi:hypothetical protein
MMEIHVRPIALAAGCLLLAACASGAGTTETPSTPAPKPGEPEAPAPPAGGHGPAVTFRPVQGAAYRVERHDSLTLQYEGGASQQQLRDRSAVVRLSLAPGTAPGSYRVTIVLDSLDALENGVPVPIDSAAAARGTQWTGTLTADGALQNLQANRQSLLGDELASTLRLLLPRIPQGGVREGMAWSDTTEYPLVADAFAGNEKAAITYRASETETNGRKAIALESDGTYSRSGTRLQGEQELQMTASGNRKASHRIAMEGMVLSAQGSDAGEMTISVPALGQTVPVKQSSSYSITAASPSAR